MWNEVKNISDWQVLRHMNSGGTRNKKIITDPKGDLYYFKESYTFKESGLVYVYEFYSEVIASFIGDMIGLNVLKYIIATHNNRIGCLSKSMIKEDEELLEGVKFIQAYDNSFVIADEKPKEKYTFQLIKSALEHFSVYKDSYDSLVEMIIFDAIIGNSDRHQENWGFISKPTFISEAFNEIEKVLKEEPTSLPKWVIKFIKNNIPIAKPSHEIITQEKLKATRIMQFAPIYDSGCCFGRQFTEEKIELYIKDVNALKSYINKGSSTIYWNKLKKTHFDLLLLLVEEDPSIKLKIKDLLNKIDLLKFKEFITALDYNLPPDFHYVKISDVRKEFIVKLLTLRVETINKIIDV